MGWYALWQARDYFLDRGIPTAIVGLLLGYITAAETLQRIHVTMETMPQRVIAKYGSLEAARLPLLKQASESFLSNILGSIVFIGVLLAINGIIASDRSKGYYRFLFAKPVSPVRYYGQAFVVHWVGFVVTLSLLALLYGVMVYPILSFQFLGVTTAMFLMYGGVMFLLSASMRGDWLVLALFTAMSTALWSWFGQSPSIFSGLLYLLPPLHRTPELYGAVAAGSPVNRGLLSWLAAYGALCVAAALLVVRHRRMAVE